MANVSDGVKAKTIIIFQVLPHQPPVRDPVTSSELSCIFHNAIHSVEVLKSADLRYSEERSQQSVLIEMLGLEIRGVFSELSKEDIPTEAILLGHKFILAIKDGNTHNERYKTRAVALSHKNMHKTCFFTSMCR